MAISFLTPNESQLFTFNNQNKAETVSTRFWQRYINVPACYCTAV